MRLLAALFLVLFFSLPALAADDVDTLKARSEKGDAAAQEQLGTLYWDGLMGLPNPVEAVKWWREAAEQGNTAAQVNLSGVLESGEGVKKDLVEAAKWYKALEKTYRNAAEQGNLDAQFEIGGMYYYGRPCVNKNLAEAMEWYHRSANQGNAEAETRLGMMYDQGFGISQQADATEAAKWYRKAADQNYARAQHDLGRMYEHGRGVKQDYAEAYFWYSLASIDDRDHSKYERAHPIELFFLRVGIHLFYEISGKERFKNAWLFSGRESRSSPNPGRNCGCR